MRIFRSSLSQITLTGLNNCLSYWVVVSAVDCVNRVRSAPQVIGLVDVTRLEFIISRDNITCENWVAHNYARKISDVEERMKVALERSPSCGLSVPCMADSQFTCGNNQHLIAFE